MGHFEDVVRAHLGQMFLGITRSKVRLKGGRFLKTGRGRGGRALRLCECASRTDVLRDYETQSPPKGRENVFLKEGRFTTSRMHL